MKKLSLALFALTLLAAAPAARADTTGWCKSGPVIAACPSGTDSNVSVASPSGQQNGSQSVAFQANPPSVVPSTNSSQSVVPAASLNGRSVADSNNVSRSGSVAYGGNSPTSSGSSVAYSGGGASSSQSVVH